MTTFTAREVRESAIAVVSRGMEYEAEMLRAYADRLEADEKGKPVADYDPRASFTVPIDTTTLQRNATHPAPADAERLSEETMLRHGWAYSYSGTDLYADDGELQDNVEFPHIDFLRDRAQEIHQKIAKRGAKKLVAHSAQAQPPAASVTDEMIERARSAFVRADDGSTGITDAIRAALLAAQENPNV